MDETHLRQLIETNFQLLSLSMREMGARFEEQRQSQQSIQEALALAHVQSQRVLDLATDNRNAIFEIADQLDETLEAIKLLAFGSVEDRQRIGRLEDKYEGLVSRIERLEETG